MLRVPRLRMVIKRPRPHTDVDIYVPAHEVPLMKFRWKDKQYPDLATVVPHRREDSADHYFYDFVSVEAEIARLAINYADSKVKDGISVFDSVYQDSSELAARIEADLEKFAANPVLPETARPLVPPPALVELLEGIKDNLGENSVDNVALSLAASGLISVKEIADAPLSVIAKADLLSTQSASAIRDAARTNKPVLVTAEQFKAKTRKAKEAGSLAPAETEELAPVGAARL